MEDSIKTAKSIMDFLNSVGWNWLPLVASAIIVFAIRAVFEPDIINVQDQPAKRYRGLIKLASLVASVIVGIVAQIAMTRPADDFGMALAIVIGVSDAFFAMVIYSLFEFLNVMGRLKDKFGWTPK